MPFITSDQIRDMSIKTVEGFLNDRVPLSEGLAKHASYHSMNSDQVQRAVEATNSIAYLKVLSLSTDRTVEFPLCKYAEVMQDLTVPKTLFKTAAVVEQEPIIVKESAYVAPKMNEVERQIYMTKAAAHIERELQVLKDKEMFMGPDLIKAASDFKKDPQALEKLATVVDGQDFQMVSKLMFGVSQEYADTGIFKIAELKEAKALVGLLKEAKELVTTIKAKEELLKQGGLEKAAFLGGMASLAGRAIGSIASAPVKFTGKVISNTAHNLFNSSKAGFVRRGIGFGALGVAGTVALDSTMYSPGKDATTGRSKNVWNSLQQEPK